MCAYGFQQRLIIASGKRYFLSLQEVTIGNIMEGISCEFRRNYKVCQYVRNDCCHLSVIFHALSFFFVKFKYKIGNFDILSESYSYSSH